MRYLTVSEVKSLGHEPNLVYNGDAISFRHTSTKQVIAHGSVGYEATISLIDFAHIGTARPFQKV